MTVTIGADAASMKFSVFGFCAHHSGRSQRIFCISSTELLVGLPHILRRQAGILKSNSLSSWFSLGPVNQFAYLWSVYFEAGTAVIGPSWSHTKNAINFAGSVWLAFADTR